MGIHLEKGGPPPPSPTLGSVQHLVLRRHRALFLACCFLLALTSVFTVFTLGVERKTSKFAPTELRPVEIHRGSHEHVPSLIPRKIWQVMLPGGGKTVDLYNVDPEKLKDTSSWLAKNVDYQYHLVGPRTADEFVQTNFASNQRLLNAYHNLTNMGMKSDLLRYLILSVEGGVYSDMDTIAIRPVDAWIPRLLRDRIRLVVGIEFDKLDGPNWPDIPHDVQLCQWTIAAAPGHPVFTRMVERILDTLDDLSAQHGVPISEIKPGSFEVMNSTGPAAWTDVVFDTLQRSDPMLKETSDLSFLKKAKAFGDVLVLPIDGFGMGQVHSDSTNDGSVPPGALIKHEFWGSWREPKADGDNEEGRDEQEPASDNKSRESDDALKQQQKPASQRLADHALQLQEAQRMKEGARILAEEAQRQKDDAMKTMGKPDEHDHHEHSPVPAQTAPPSAEVPATSAPSLKVATPAMASSALPRPATGSSSEAQEYDEEHFRSDEEVLEVDTSSPPIVVPEEKEKEEKQEVEFDPDEDLMIDSGSPPWPGPEWAP
ncbi:hypothetical protein NLU13_8924 [Sarocladium strictum]|uniref:Uncharacterized protein n=1 Tax=Sarocladium strictum TaxID=5046 RepID=A0AA39GAB2_SARSR|nr:hypothetical protein NLU13_8924 [Sarocladium strictum]